MTWGATKSPSEALRLHLPAPRSRPSSPTRYAPPPTRKPGCSPRWRPAPGNSGPTVGWPPSDRAALRGFPDDPSRPFCTLKPRRRRGLPRPFGSSGGPHRAPLDDLGQLPLKSGTRPCPTPLWPSPSWAVCCKPHTASPRRARPCAAAKQTRSRRHEKSASHRGGTAVQPQRRRRGNLRLSQRLTPQHYAPARGGGRS